MTTRRTNQPLVLEDREDLERHVYTRTPGDLSLEQARDRSAQEFTDNIASGKSPSVVHNDNGDEEKYEKQDFLGSFCKGLPRQPGTGAAACLPEHDEFLRFRRATHTGNFFVGPDIPKLGTNLTDWRVAKKGTCLRGWEAPEAGLSHEPHGPDSHSVTMAAAPKLESDQLAFEMAEVYWLSLLRDIPFSEFNQNPEGISSPACETNRNTIIDAVEDLNNMDYAKNGFRDEAGECDGIPSRSRQVDDEGKLTPANVFRGVTPGDTHGPYLSQFLLAGCPAQADKEKRFDLNNITKGTITYGAQLISQKQRPHKACLDHMTDRASFLDVQEGAKVNGSAQFEDKPRFIATPRDLATYVHYDALYQAYLNACLMLLGFEAPADPGITAHNNLEPLSGDLENVTEGFALFGGPHILNLVTEVATRGLKAVRYQKFNVHCRLRPEAVGGNIEFDPHGIGTALRAGLSSDLIDRIAEWNVFQNDPANFALRTELDPTRLSASGSHAEKTLLLAMAFPEGSPMHPSYGAGHATVAGACVTMLKAFFDTDAVIVKDTIPKPEQVKIIPREMYENDRARYSPFACEPNADGSSLLDVSSTITEPLTVGGELDKLAANISIARNMAGVHFYTDYIDSLTMGEEVAVRTLSETMSAFTHYPLAVRPSMSLPKFLGGRECIGTS